MNAITYISSSSGNRTNIKDSFSLFFGFSAYNSTAATRYLKVYNTSSAPTQGTTAGLIGNFALVTSVLTMNEFDSPVKCPSGLGFTIVSGIETTSTGSIGAKDIALTMYYL